MNFIARFRKCKKSKEEEVAARDETIFERVIKRKKLLDNCQDSELEVSDGKQVDGIGRWKQLGASS